MGGHSILTMWSDFWKKTIEIVAFIFTNKNDAAVTDPIVPTPVILNPTPPLTMPEILYDTAKGLLGKHLTLNSSVPPEVGCAEAVSTVLLRAGITGVPVMGIASTAVMATWFANSKQFEEIMSPEEGAVIVSPTGSGNGTVRGHVGIIGRFDLQYRGDWGIMSNDSQTGLFLELWNYVNWNKYYGAVGSLKVRMFRAVS